MEEIEVGDYVRTKKKGIIGKIEQIGVSLFWLEDGSAFNIKEELYKHSKNIIDLIEVGDYVNGYKVVETFKDSKREEELWLGVVVSSKMIKVPLQEYFDNEMIKSVVTHEQFSSMEYKVEE